MPGGTENVVLRLILLIPPALAYRVYRDAQGGARTGSEFGHDYSAAERFRRSSLVVGVDQLATRSLQVRSRDLVEFPGPTVDEHLLGVVFDAETEELEEDR